MKIIITILFLINIIIAVYGSITFTKPQFIDWHKITNEVIKDKQKELVRHKAKYPKPNKIRQKEIELIEDGIKWLEKKQLKRLNSYQIETAPKQKFYNSTSIILLLLNAFLLLPLIGILNTKQTEPTDRTDGFATRNSSSRSDLRSQLILSVLQNK